MPPPQWYNSSQKQQRNFLKDPLVLQGNPEEVLIWELKCPELEALLLPPDHLQEFFTSFLVSDTTEKDGTIKATNQKERKPPLLHQQLKQHCIQQITDSIDPERDGDDAKSKLNSWLQNFDCKSIVKLFSKLNGALPCLLKISFSDVCFAFPELNRHQTIDSLCYYVLDG